MEPFLGQIIMFGGNFAPRGWALCDGQLLPISSNTALFSILGTMYGGDGRTTFGLPDLRSRVPIHAGRGPGLSEYRLGQKGGTETVTLTPNQMPSHSHSLPVNSEAGTEKNPNGRYLATADDGERNYAATATPGANSQASNSSGGNQDHTNIQPFQCVNYIIALQGIFPSRS